MAASRPILVLDSGVGGLSVLAEIAKALPDAPLLYVADSAFFPYGTRSAREIEARVPFLLGPLVERFDPVIVVIACNTASTIALDAVREALDRPVVGTVPAIKPAAALSVTRAIGVLGTPATIVQPYVDRLALRFAPDCAIIRHGSSELVELAEAKLRGERLLEGVVADAVAPLVAAQARDQIDTLVLACTHFPLIAGEIAAAFPTPIRLVDGAAGIARQTARLTANIRWEGPGEGTALFTSATPDPKAYRAALASYRLTRIATF